MTRKEWWLRQAARALGFGTVLGVVVLAGAAMDIYEFYQRGWWLRQVAPHLLVTLVLAAALLLALAFGAARPTRSRWLPALGRTAKAFGAGTLFGAVVTFAVIGLTSLLIGLG